ncbi:MAG: uroporphyrinogen decarboxylase family protein [Spirochaetota bacterium]
MTSYERVKAAVEHREADKVPFDLGGSVLTGINRKAYVNLRAYLGLPEAVVSIVDEMQQLARPDADFLRKIEVDVACIDPDGPSTPGLATRSTRDGEYLRMNDEWGIEWRMPVDNGLYYDMTGHPLATVDSIAALDAYPWPDPADPARFATLKARADKAVFQDKQAYILGRQYAGIWETALWMSGFEKFFTDMMVEKDYAHALMDKITELKMIYWEKALAAVGDNVLIISEADDLATQNSLLCSPQLYKEMVHPYHKKLFSFIKSKAPHKVHIFYHTCGAVKPLIPYLIEEGVDILNPVQVNADGMDSRLLKKEFGKDMTFWGGGVDTQHVLPFGTPAEVRDEVKRRIDDFAPGGGFVFAAVHNVQGDVPPENFMAMREALADFGVY